MPQPRVGCEIPQDWKVKIDTIAAQTGRTSDQVVYEAIARYLQQQDLQQQDLQRQASGNDDLLQPLVSRLESLEQEAVVAREALAQVQRLSVKLEQLERAIAFSSPAIATLSNVPINSSPIAAHPIDNESDEIEDEPDEILWDFLEPEQRSHQLALLNQQSSAHPTLPDCPPDAEKLPQPPSSQYRRYGLEIEEGEDEPDEILWDFVDPT